MASRVLAVVAALGMIAGAYVYRYGAPGGDGSGGGSGRDAAAGAVICASELGPACDALPGATVERAAETAERLADARTVPEAGVRTWVAPGPWAAMVDEERRLRKLPPLFTKDEVVASTPLVALVKKGKTPASCGTAITWQCLGEAAQDPVNRIGVEPSQPTDLLVRAAVLVGFFGTTEFGSNDFPEAQPVLDAFGARNAEASARGATDLQRFLISAPDVPLYLTNDAAALVNPTVDVVVPTPKIVLQAVASSRADQDVDLGGLRKSLEAAGWSRGGAGGSGLPSPGVLLALREALS